MEEECALSCGCGGPSVFDDLHAALGVPPLGVAIRAGRIEWVRASLARGADVNEKFDINVQDHIEIRVRAFERMGRVDPMPPPSEHRDKHDATRPSDELQARLSQALTPLGLYFINGLCQSSVALPQYTQLCPDVDMLEILLDAGASPETLNAAGIAPIHTACQLPRTEYLERLLLRKPSLRDLPASGPYRGWTPLHFAAHSGNVQVVQFLVAAGAPLTKQGTGHTPLDLAKDVSAGLEPGVSDQIAELLQQAQEAPRPPAAKKKAAPAVRAPSSPPSKAKKAAPAVRASKSAESRILPYALGESLAILLMAAAWWWWCGRSWSPPARAPAAGARRRKPRKPPPGASEPSVTPVASPAAATTTEDEAILCCVCLEQPKTHLLFPCGHKCLCAVCVVDFQVHGAVCPICRESVDSTVRVYE